MYFLNVGLSYYPAISLLSAPDTPQRAAESCFAVSVIAPVTWEPLWKGQRWLWVLPGSDSHLCQVLLSDCLNFDLIWIYFLPIHEKLCGCKTGNNLSVAPKRVTAAFDVCLIWGTLVCKGRDSSVWLFSKSGGLWGSESGGNRTRAKCPDVLPTIC